MDGLEQDNKSNILAFNAPFLAYEGMQRGATVRTLVNTVIASNEQNPDITISINGVNNGEELASYASTLDASQTYNVIISTDDQTGYVNAINII